jgi:hypothetical protein
MRVERTSLRTLMKRFEIVRGPTHLRRLALVWAIVVATYCQSQTAMADGGANVNATTGIPAIAGFDIPPANNSDLPPKIINFAASKGSANTWVISGTVIDDDMTDITVQLGGYLQGVTVCPAADGSFSYSFYLAPGQFAYIAALAIEDDGGCSQPAETYVVGY